MTAPRWVLEIFQAEISTWMPFHAGPQADCDERLAWYQSHRPDLDGAGQLRVRQLTEGESVNATFDLPPETPPPAA